MDRNKAVFRGHKAKISTTRLGGELYALGTKSSRDDNKSKILSMKGSVPLANERKRCASSSFNTVSKKQKLDITSSTSGKYANEKASLLEAVEPITIDTDPLELCLTLFSAIEKQDSTTVISSLCRATKLLIQTSVRMKEDNILILSLVYIAKVRPVLYCNDIVTNELLSILRKGSLNTFKIRPNSSIHVLASNFLYCGYADKRQWPEVFLRCYIDDAVNDRFWVDNELCSPFIKNICCAFGTRTPSKFVLQAEGGFYSTPSTTSQSLDGNMDDEFGLNIKCNVQNRYASSLDVMEKYIIDAVKEQISKRQSQDCYTRNFLKFLCTTSGLSEVRCLSISRLELWIHNSKLTKPAQELLTYICFNINSNCVKDQEVLASLVKMRLKTKPLINLYMACLKEMITLNSNILPVVLKLVLQNELSNARNPNNMGVLATLFQTYPELSARHLAEIYKEFLLQREDSLRTLRVFLRELVRMLRFDINIVEFVKAFLNGRPELTPQIQQSDFRERIFHSMVDITCLCMLLAVSPQVREAYISLRNGREMKSNPILLNFYLQISQIQLDAVSWMYELVPNIYKLQGVDYSQALNKLLLLESPDQYSRCDQWPSEPERSTLLRIVSETPIYEDSLLRIILIGITQDIPFTIPETFEVLLLVIKRASALRNTDIPVVHANKFEIIDFLFSMAEYHYPESINIPNDYSPPKLAITVLYWKAWIIMLMISAHNPSTFGAFCWDHYPTMKALMEMCITNQLNDSFIAKDELQISALEREQIIEFETYLAAQTSQTVITEENAILLSQVMLMDPMGPARRVPSVILEQLKQLNKTLKLGHLLCRSRKPDLLLEIIQRQGTSQSMPWLSDLVQNSDGEFRHLPVQCLCEFLLSNVSTLSEENNRDAKLLNYLRKLIREENSDKQIVCEVLDYIFRRLSSTVKQSRCAALAGLKLLLKDEENWLLFSLPQLPYFGDINSLIIPQLRSACQVENIPQLVMTYIQFIAAHTQNDPVTVMLEHVIDMAQLIVERNTMFQHITPIPTEMEDDLLNDCRQQTLKCLFVMFNNYIIKLREHQESYEWAQYPDLLMVQFEDGVQLPIHLNIIHAFVILLTHSSISIPESIPILDYWFPPGRPAPTAFIPDLRNDQVQFLPDWLKLKMIRSSVDRLISAAMYELTPDQIVLFVQNFGTPVSSMSKLLALLDHAVIEQFETVKNAILNKAYLAQLIEIQQTRGAKNGHVTVQALELHSHSQTVPDLPKLKIDKLECIDPSHLKKIATEDYSSSQNDTTDIGELIDQIVNTSHLSMSITLKFHKLIHQILRHCGYTLDTRKNYTVSVTKQVLEKIIQLTSKSSIIFQSIETRKHICTLLRVLMTNNPETREQPKAIIDKLVNIFNMNSQNSLEGTSKCIPLFQNHNENYCKIEHQLTEYIGGDTELLKQMLSKVYHIKNSGRKLIYEMVKNKSTSVFIDKIITSLQVYATNAMDVIQNNAEYSHHGVLVDWLVEVDPELIMVDRSLQMNLMFSKTYKDFRFYLLSLLCHETTWYTLNETVNYLLEKFRPEFNQSAILNFIEALMNNPRLWKGRDKTIPRNFKPDVLFVLDETKLQVLTQYILEEGEADISTNQPNINSEKLCSRIDLLFKLSNKKVSFLFNCLDFVLKYPCTSILKLQFLQQSYMLYPKVKFMTGEFNYIYASGNGNVNCFRSDKVANYLITCLGNLLSKKDFETLSSDTELLMRKLAASHPALFLRQLGVLCSQIQGKSHINIRVLRDEHHIHRFMQILRTLEVLQPMVFNDEYKQNLQSCLDCYFTFLKYNIREKETYQIVIKLVELIQAYIKINPSTAFVYVEKYTDILQELSEKFGYLVTLQQLVQGLSVLKHNSIISRELREEEIRQEFCLDDVSDSKSGAGAGAGTGTVTSDNDALDTGTISEISLKLDIESKVTTSLAFSEVHKKSLHVPSHIFNLIQIIKSSGVEEVIIGPLQEVESITSKRFSFLHELFDRLLDLIFSTSAQIRSNAYILLIRHLKNQPGRSDIIRCTLNAFIQCLLDDNSSVASTAVDNLVEMVVLLQEHTVEILGVAFLLGIKSKINSCAQIKRAMQTLMLQQGY